MIYSMQFPLLLMELFSLSGSLTSSILGGPDCCGWCWGCFTLWRACYSCSIRSAGCKVQNPILICPLLNTKCRTYTWYANVMSTMWLFGHTSNVRILLYFIPFGFLDLVCIKNLSEVHLAGYEFFFQIIPFQYSEYVRCSLGHQILKGSFLKKLLMPLV